MASTTVLITIVGFFLAGKLIDGKQAVNLVLTVCLYMSERATGQAQTLNCTLGNPDQKEARDFQMSGIFLDLDHPAECPGSVIAWHLCHYRPFLFSTTEYNTDIQIWRETSNATYTRIYQTTQTDEIPRRTSDFFCLDVIPQQKVEVRRGDVFGIYFPSVRGLRMVAMNKPGNRLFYSAVSPGDAEFVNWLTLSSMQELTQHVLHLAADVGEPTKCMYGINLIFLYRGCAHFHVHESLQYMPLQYSGQLSFGNHVRGVVTGHVPSY